MYFKIDGYWPLYKKTKNGYISIFNGQIHDGIVKNTKELSLDDAICHVNNNILRYGEDIDFDKELSILLKQKFYKEVLEQ